jgi:hypothetical protein
VITCKNELLQLSVSSDLKAIVEGLASTAALASLTPVAFHAHTALQFRTRVLRSALCLCIPSCVSRALGCKLVR